ncbi:uncharacterized protein LOC117730549 isoform X2 [Cyclopterus lumpus]|uniref:uncharacterized protein LOC117730549 isoform X2 n=1 Tax=Cyclopterus lumpus TaxID=8103 RepID=UPI0014865B4B|nr:uncharacterized protein LOC117730549 isoform X2 [Cyclopterus lumpus]
MMKSLHVYIGMAVMSVLAFTATTETAGRSLKGKMFTLSRDRGGISFFPPSHSPTSSPYYTTTGRPYYTTTRRPYYTTTHKPTLLPYTTRRPYYTTTHKPTLLPYTTRRPYYTTTHKPTLLPYTTRRPYYTTTHKPTLLPYTTRRPYYTTTRPYYTPTRPTTRRPYYTTTRRPYYTTTHKPTLLPYTTRRPYYTTTRPYYTTTRPWTTAPVTRGVSVCVRYLADSISSVFTLSSSTGAFLKLSVEGERWYTLNLDRYGYRTMTFRPYLKFWSNMVPDIWTRVCVTVDSMKNVAQVFSGSDISIRKMIPYKYEWSGVPVIDFSGFEGQLTDVQVWDYALCYKEVFNYMTSGIYAPYRGSILSWSDISYSPRGKTLLEETYERQARQPIGSSGERKGRHPKTWAFSNLVESQNEQL